MRYSKRKKWVILLSRSILFFLMTLVLARTSLLIPTKGQSVVFVVDRSASIENVDHAIAFIKQAIETKKPDDQFAVVSVGKHAVVEQAWTREKQPPELNTVVEKHATNLESGLRLAGGLLSDEDRGRIILLSDGKETIASAQKEVEWLKSRGVRIDVVPLSTKQGPEVMISDFNVPKQLHLQEKYEIKVTLIATMATKTKLRLFIDDELTHEERVSVKRGENQFTFSGNTKKSGFLRFRAEIEPDQDTIVQNNQSYGFSQVKDAPMILMIEQTPRDSNNLAAALEASGMRVERRAPSDLPKEITDYKRYDSMVLVNTPATEFTSKTLELIRSAVRDLGIGLLTVGGEQAYALGGWFQTPLEEILPVRMDLQDQQRSPSLGLVLVIDKSGSMAGEKIELAKEAAIRSTFLFDSQDELGLLTFDTDTKWVMKPRKIKNREQLQYMIQGIPANGETEMYSALEHAYKEIRKLKTMKRHIILLTDGQSKGSYDQLVQKMKNEKITLTTVAIGKDADHALLQRLSKEGQGRYYEVFDPQMIPTIISKETVISKRSYIVEKSFLPQMTGGFDWKPNMLPPLRAYVGTTAKQTAEKVLMSPYPDPVLARWQYGLGRTVAWTSDLNGKWSKSWVEWSEFQKFWNQVVSWTFPQVETKGWRFDVRTVGVKNVVELVGPSEETDGIHQVRLSVIDEHDQRTSIVLKPTSRESFEGDFPHDRPGTYMMNAVAETKQGTKTLGSFAWVIPYSHEYRDVFESGQKKLQQLARLGYGEVLSEPLQAFADDRNMKWTVHEVSFPLFFITALLWPVDIAIRRLSSIKWFPIRRKKGSLPKSAPPNGAKSQPTLSRLLAEKRRGEEKNRKKE